MASRQWDPLFVLQVCLPRFICLLPVDLRFKLCQVNRYFRTTLLTPYWEAQALLGCLRDHWCGGWPDEILVALDLVQHENYTLGPDTAPDWSGALCDLFGSESVVEEERNPPSEVKKFPCPDVRVKKEPPPSLKLSNWHQAYAVCTKLKGEPVRTLTSISQIENWLQRTVVESELTDDALLCETPCVCFESDAWDVAKNIVRQYWSSKNHLQLPLYPLALLKHSSERREWALADPLEFIKATHNTHSHWSTLDWDEEPLRGMPVNDLGDLSDLDYDTVCSWQWLCSGEIQPYTGDWSAHVFETQTRWLAERTVRFAKTWCKTHSISPLVDQQFRYFAVWFNWSLGGCALIGAQQRVDILFSRIC
eukprot:Protomagalhaensia_wolfi_Nauph_80__124@NODE_106_length_3690_cov_178_707204_g80_i0_p1_GENE_NODE_106_length_3690_cov_178_707204_g80_i0NODE_106_length_3690_cov_178_707204_g80_i0_p1_ORF_typecomplete_len364_score39_64_NODE_106_length_3690_cov_178_707204_g80_i024683559